MSPTVALIFGLILSVISIPMLTLLSNPLCGLLAGLALVSYVMIYTPLKRVSSYNTLVGAFPRRDATIDRMDRSNIQHRSRRNSSICALFLWQIPHSLAITIYRQREYNNAGIVVLPSVQGLESTRFQMLMYTCALLPIPPLSFLNTRQRMGNIDHRHRTWALVGIQSVGWICA